MRNVTALGDAIGLLLAVGATDGDRSLIWGATDAGTEDGGLDGEDWPQAATVSESPTMATNRPWVGGVARFDLARRASSRGPRWQSDGNIYADWYLNLNSG